MQRSEWFQISLIIGGVLTAALLGLFVYREIFPEYKVYQENYQAVEEFRAEYTGNPPPEFREGVKQIVIPRQDNGPEVVDRCISCHVATQLPHFSPTKIALDINGKMKVDSRGYPVLIPNPDYVWKQLDETIAKLSHEETNRRLIADGKHEEAKDRRDRAEYLNGLRYKEVDGKIIDMSKALAMHPLMGLETRPFEYHPLDDYGCTACHSGNGRALTFSHAHGPVIDSEYEGSHSYKPPFGEIDPENDPKFARVFNSKPGEELIFQTSPILVGHLMQAMCVQCHVSTDAALNKIVDSMNYVAKKKDKLIEAIGEGYKDNKEALISLYENYLSVEKNGYEKTIQDLNAGLENPKFTPFELDRLEGRRSYLQQFAAKSGGKHAAAEFDKSKFYNQVQEDIVAILGSVELALQLKEVFIHEKKAIREGVEDLLQKMTLVERAPLAIFPESHREDVLQNALAQAAIGFVKIEPENFEKSGTIFAKKLMETEFRGAVAGVNNAKDAFKFIAGEPDIVHAMATPVDSLISDYKRGLNLYISNACYACHRITGLSRGNVGPDLTSIGFSYPWYVKASIVWPQGKLPDSQMPTFGMDHADVEDLMTFMMAQRGQNKTTSLYEQQANTKAWELGQKLPWEEPLPPSKMLNTTVGMEIFATEGCASCHKLEGYESNAGFSIEKDVPKNVSSTMEFQAKLLGEYEWFKGLIPEQITGYNLVEVIEANAVEIDKRVVDNVRSDTILEKIEEAHPRLLESYFANFTFASRAKNAFFANQMRSATPEEQKKLEKEQELWKERTNRLMLMYIQTYGLGRLIAPRLNWTGVYRNDEWMMGHFHNPAAYSARSIMPVFPFDDSKFYTLSHMLHQLGKKNRDAANLRWQIEGFNPEEAYQLYCSACHGEDLHGDGPVSKWIYPVPKNLRNSIFLESLTKERAIHSIIHGVKGTPMPAWGEVLPESQLGDDIPVLTYSEIQQLTDWIFRTLPHNIASMTEEKVQKWHYTIQDVVKGMQDEGDYLKGPAIVRGNQVITPKPSNLTVSEFFNVVTSSNKVSGDIEDENSYYIKPMYYTEANIEEGRRLFTLNCAVCHGSDAGGMGPRAAVMVDAKPRMLANLPWLQSRDDLRLLRSIKFGVPGTAMTPWGDQTSVVQEMQLVIFIRSLTKEKSQHDLLTSSIYNAFTIAQLAVDEARIGEYDTVQTIQLQYNNAVKEGNDLLEKVKRLDMSTEVAGQVYMTQLNLMNQLARWHKVDDALKKLNEANKQEEGIYDTLGASLIIKQLDDEIVDNYLEMIKIHKPLLKFQNKQLQCDYDLKIEDEIVELQKKFVARLDKLRQMDDKEYEVILGKLPSPERMAKSNQIDLRRNALIQLKTRFITQMELAAELRKKQCAIFDDYQKERKEMIGNKTQSEEERAALR